MEIVRLTNQDKQFYVLMGPFLARREIEKKIGHQLYDDNAKVWVIAIEDNVVLGFCYVWKFWDRYKIGSWYAVDEDMQGSLFESFLDEITGDIEGIIKVVTKNTVLQDMLISMGFQVRHARKRFTEYEKEYGENVQKPSL